MRQSHLYPKIEFILDYEETETPFGGNIVIKNGETLSDMRYDEYSMVLCDCYEENHICDDNCEEEDQIKSITIYVLNKKYFLKKWMYYSKMI